jgi:hypothetical protein
MRSFLKGHNPWFYVTRDLKKPIDGAIEIDEAFDNRLIDWTNNHHQILTWFHTTTIPSISELFASNDDSKGAWGMLASRYSSVDCS